MEDFGERFLKSSYIKNCHIYGGAKYNGGAEEEDGSTSGNDNISECDGSSCEVLLKLHIYK